MIVRVAGNHAWPVRTVMPNKPLFIFQCDHSDYFALSKKLKCRQRLTKEFGSLHWRLRRRLRASEMGAAYFEASMLLKDREVCLVRRRSDGALECACNHLPLNGLAAPDQTEVHGCFGPARAQRSQN